MTKLDPREENHAVYNLLPGHDAPLRLNEQFNNAQAPQGAGYLPPGRSATLPPPSPAPAPAAQAAPAAPPFSPINLLTPQNISQGRAAMSAQPPAPTAQEIYRNAGMSPPPMSVPPTYNPLPGHDGALRSMPPAAGAADQARGFLPPGTQRPGYGIGDAQQSAPAAAPAPNGNVLGRAWNSLNRGDPVRDAATAIGNHFADSARQAVAGRLQEAVAESPSLTGSRLTTNPREIADMKARSAAILNGSPAQRVAGDANGHRQMENATPVAAAPVPPAKGTKLARPRNPLAAASPAAVSPERASLQSDVSENPILWVSAGSPQRHPDGSLYTHQVAYRDGSMSYHASNALPKEVQDFYARTADTKGDALDPVQIIRGDGHSGMANVYDERGHLIGQQNAGSTTMSLPGKPGQAYGEVPQDVYDTGRVAEYQQAQASRSINPLADRQAMEVAAAAEHNKGQIGAARLNANAHIEASTNLLKQPHAQSTVERNDLTGATKETTYGPVLNADGTPAKPRQPQAGTVTPGKVAGRVYTDKNGNRATYKGKDASGQDVWEKK